MICTLTLNPAIDVHARADELRIGKENHVRITSRCAGGKGINVSRALLSYGIESRAVIVVGSMGANEFYELLSGSALEPYYIAAKGRIRENLTVHSDSGEETRISEMGSLFCSDILDKLPQALDGSDCIVLAGSVPEDVDKERLFEILREMQGRGARLVVDSRSVSYSELARLSPWLVKPNLEELSQYFGKEISSREEVVSCALQIRELGIENVMVSLGKDGAVLVCSDGLFSLCAPSVEAVSSIGAGDSAVAGFIAASTLGLSVKDCLRYALAFGSAACMEEGTEPPTRVNIDKLISEL